MSRRRVASLAAALLGVGLGLGAWPRVAAADGPPRVRLQLNGSAYAGLPFGLAVVADGFDEDPAPAQPPLTIPGASVQPLGVQPNVSQSIQIINGRRYDSRDVTYVFQYRVLVEKPGDFQVPAITIAQGGKRASTDPARLSVGELPTTDDMKLVVHVPDRPLWVGETFPLQIDWLVRRNIQDQQLSIPMLLDEDRFQVTAPPVADPSQALSFPAGTHDVTLPFVQDQVDADGRHYTRFQFTALVTPRQAGHIDLPPAQVVAKVAVGAQDFFGRSRTQLERAVDQARSIDVKPLPLSGRPADFAGAVGTSFSIATRASRSVVQLGEPVDLDVTVKSDTRLDALSLGKLDLPAAEFSVPADPPAGTLSDDGKTKTFTVPVQVVGAATEIPAIPLSYFDPVKATYQTIHSDPIALSVKGTAVVGAADVVGTAPRPRAGSAATPATTDADDAQVVADLALSSPGDALSRPLGGATLWGLVLALYLLPLAVFAIRTWQVRTAAGREEAGEVRAARRQVEAQLVRAQTQPARELATSLPAALRALARTLGRPADDGGVIARIETEAFSPRAATEPLPAALRADVEALVRGWLTARRTSGPARRGVGAAVVLAIIAAPAAVRAAAPGPVSAPGTAPAAAPVAASGSAAPVAAPGSVPAAAAAELASSASSASASAAAPRLEEARTAYQAAMAAPAPERRRAFARAAAEMAAAVDARPGRPDLLTDWGNAALGAGDFGTATLAYRRALAIDPGASRARSNLAWLRSREPAGMRPSEGGAADALFFFHHDWTRARRLVVGAAAFALAVLLLVPWGPRRRRLFVGLAIAAGAVWLAMTTSVLIESSHAADAVVVEGTTLRAADNAGAPAALSTPIPAGAEATVVERRGGWTRISLPGGAAGWLPDGAVAMVTPGPD